MAPWGQRRRRAAARVGVLVGSLVVAGTGLAVLAHRFGFGGFGEGCTARVGTRKAELSLGQGGNAATVVAVAVRRDLPARAATIALATAMQESKLRNLSYGDRDSLGLFQQRPSQGWGTKAQVMNPVHAANAFYDALVQIPGYQTLPIDTAAQDVQHSGHPDGYAQHESAARALSSALTGQSAAAFNCVVSGTQLVSATVGGPSPATRAQTASGALTDAFGSLLTTGTPDTGGTVVVTVPAGPESDQRAWAAAEWLVAQAKTLGLSSVECGGRIWNAHHSSAGWTNDPNTFSGAVRFAVA
ncbi:MAG TPA: hypothetical protein VHV82_11835 [Sporichthyaceae bacterium]|jgi:hypothetical protein|nr:hypothetical protein [Sporichthyaceae bacterium]